MIRWCRQRINNIILDEKNVCIFFALSVVWNRANWQIQKLKDSAANFLIKLKGVQPALFSPRLLFLDLICCCHCCCRYSCSIYSNLPCLYSHTWHCLLVFLTVNGDGINAVRRYTTNRLVVWTHFIHSVFSQVQTKRAVCVIELSLTVPR